MAASQGYYASLASVLDEPAPPDGIGEACDSRAPRLITGASAIEEMAMGGGAAPPPPRVREMHPLGMARAMKAPGENDQNAREENAFLCRYASGLATTS